MLSKRVRTWLGLGDIACVVGILGLTALAGVPPARFPRNFKIVEFGILGFFVPSLLYRVMAQLPPIRFRIQTIMIVVAVVAVQLTTVRVITQMFGPGIEPGVGWGLYAFALLGTIPIVRAWTHDPKKHH
jgi:hypothetical protein